MGKRGKKITRTFKVKKMETKVKIDVDKGNMIVKIEAEGLLYKKSGDLKKMEFKIKNSIPLNPDMTLQDMQAIADNHKLTLLEAYVFSELKADTSYDTKV